MANEAFVNTATCRLALCSPMGIHGFCTPLFQHRNSNHTLIQVTSRDNLVEGFEAIDTPAKYIVGSDRGLDIAVGDDAIFGFCLSGKLQLGVRSEIESYIKERRDEIELYAGLSLMSARFVRDSSWESECQKRLAHILGISRHSDMAAAVQHRIRPARLELDLAAGTCRVDGRLLTLPPMTFLFAVALADATRRGEGLAWQDLAAPRFGRIRVEVSRLRRRGVGPDGQGRLDNLHEHEPLFRQQVSRLRQAVRKALGPAAAAYLPVTTGNRPRTRTILPLAPDAITIAGLEA